jgi:DNA mismatch endonuclease (patch repair protein)
VHTPEQRSYNMSRIRGRDTGPETAIRRALFARGHRYRIGHGLPGKPDIVFVSKRVVVFIDGCFWHRCTEHFRPPATNAEFWQAKIERNVERDREVTEHLAASGWQVLRFWEHDVRRTPEKVIKAIEDALAPQANGRSAQGRRVTAHNCTRPSG